MCDTTGWLLHHERDLRVDWRADVLGLHPAGGIEAAISAPTSVEADQLDGVFFFHRLTPILMDISGEVVL